jgi:mannitol operon repressor
MLDALLKRSIEAYLIDHKDVLALTGGFNAPIGTLATRTVMAFALALLSEEEYRELCLIRKIRNDFAHAVEASFDDQSIATRCNLLTFAAQDFDDVHVVPRDRFLTPAAALILNLVNVPTMLPRSDCRSSNGSTKTTVATNPNTGSAMRTIFMGW